MIRPVVLTVTALLILAMLGACGGGNKTQSTAEEGMTSEANEQKETPAANAAETSSNGELVEIMLEGNDLMQFSQTEIKVAAGSTIKLTLTHTGQLPVEAMGHNFVLVKNWVDLQEFGTKAVEAKDNSYIPPSMQTGVIAHTDLIGGGESTSIEFAAPAAGTYQYLCSFPGHYGIMQGKLIVE